MNDLQKQAHALVVEAAIAYAGSEDARDLAILKVIAAAAAQLEGEPARRAKKSNDAKKRKAFKRFLRLDAGAPIISQVRNLVR